MPGVVAWSPCSLSWPVLSTHFLPEVRSDFIFGILASHKLTDSLHPRFRHGLSKRQGEMKNITAEILLCPDLKYVNNWVHLSFKTAFVVVVFPYGKKITILQTRYFSFKVWGFLWLFVFHIALKFEHRALLARACIASCKNMKMAVKIVKLSSKAQLLSW